jgi:tetratricopeptide (TPR) repeat protein
MSNKLVIIICSILLLSFTGIAYSQTPFEKGLKDFKEENYEEALEYFLWARKLEPTSSSVAFYTGLTYKIMENYRRQSPT